GTRSVDDATGARRRAAEVVGEHRGLRAAVRRPVEQDRLEGRVADRDRLVDLGEILAEAVLTGADENAELVVARFERHRSVELRRAGVEPFAVDADRLLER